MTQNDIDRILSDEDEITPSSTFLDTVMVAVEQEAATPRILEFPWLRALPGMIALLAALVAATWNGIAALRDPAFLAALNEQLGQFSDFASGLGLQWVLLAAAFTIISRILASSLMRVRHSVLP